MCHTPHFTCTVIAQYRHHVLLGSRGPRAQDELCVKIGHSSTRHVSPFASQYTENPAQVLSHLPLLRYCRTLLRTQTCCPRIHLSTVKIHCRMVLLRNSTPPHIVMSLEAFQKQYLLSGTTKLKNIGLVLARILRHKAVAVCPTLMSKFRMQVADMLEKKEAGVTGHFL